MAEWLISIVLQLLLVLTGAGESAPSDSSGNVVATTTATVVRVIDGDTVDVILQNGERARVRYLGLDTPEVYYDERGNECYAAEATAANEQLVRNAEVLLVADVRDRDDYGRLLRHVYVGEMWVNERLLLSGHARLLVIPPNTDHYDTLRAARNEAKLAMRGLWQACE